MRLLLASAMRLSLVTITLFALGATGMSGYLVGSWHARAITEDAARVVIEGFSVQMSVLEGRVIALSDVCR